MLLERLRRALAPDYEVLREVAGGGMGVVFAGRQPRLDRQVAIKILRPEHATAVAAERFLAEGRLLAKLAHPNIVPVYDAGEADGLLYYVMEYVEGETLADRLTRGPLPPAEAGRLAEDVLRALSAAHALGIVHRDIKPANIFLRDGRALVGDFGIASWRAQDRPGYTTPGEMVGTPRYMAPEQRDGLPATARTDVYAVGLVFWEACTGDRWPHYQDPQRADWSRMPPGLVAPVRRSLSLEADQRWADARDFLAALQVRPRRRWPILAAVSLLVAAGVWALWPRTVVAGHGALTIALDPFGVEGPAPSLGDSVSRVVRGMLAGYPDFYLPPGQLPAESVAVRVGGAVALRDGRLRLVAHVAGSGGKDAPPIPVIVEEPSADLLLFANRIVIALVDSLYGREAARDLYLPVRALPTDPAARAALFKAEQHFSLAHWSEADQEYGDAERADTTCLLCAFRRLDIDRWFGRPQNRVRLDRLLREQNRFPAHYQALIHAAAAPPAARLDILAAAMHASPQFFLAAFEYGDELFHRGPLHGRLRADAMAPLRSALLLKPRFGPGWEHLAWLLMSQEDGAGAAAALDSLKRNPPGMGFSAALGVLLQLGLAWQYGGPDQGRAISQQMLASPDLRASTESRAGARLLMTMDAARGAVGLGDLLTRWRDRSDAVPYGLLGMLYGYAALGRLDSMRLISERFTRSRAEPLSLLALELEAVLRAFDPDSSVRHAPDLLAALEQAARAHDDQPELRRRAVWAMGLLARMSGDTARLAAALRTLAADSVAPELSALVAAADQAARGNPAAALASLPAIPDLDTEPRYADPLEDAVGHLLRADLEERVGNLRAASRTLRWHEHVQLSGHLAEEPEAGEMAWALGTLARWKRASLLTAVAEQGPEWCSVNRGIARLWADGEPVFRARAERAKRSLTGPACAAPP